ncbi:hypothetical protein V6N12_046052 [Hibiscus sabdariffa]|uniref:Uncharacterized protein n=1 Tax=Hibiscus sabdariffa TaxID=183260 RepID=A0ABR2G5G3_9ROSI
MDSVHDGWLIDPVQSLAQFGPCSPRLTSNWASIVGLPSRFKRIGPHLGSQLADSHRLQTRLDRGLNYTDPPSGCLVGFSKPTQVAQLGAFLKQMLGFLKP